MDHSRVRDLKELSRLDYYKAELELEGELRHGFLKDLVNLKIEDPAFQLKYARLQGQIDALNELSNKRNLIINSETSHSVNNKEK